MQKDINNKNLGKKPLIIEREAGSEQVKRQLVKNGKFKKLLLVVIISLIGSLLILKNPSISEVAKSVVKINVFDENDELMMNGSGFSVFKSNYVVTNYHVIEGAYRIEIVTHNNKTYPINDIQIFNTREDIAILSGDFSLKPLELANELPKAGDEVFAIGSPINKMNMITTGVVYNSDVPYRLVNSAEISPGSSGGVLLNNKKEVIGITTGQYETEEREDLYFSVGFMYIERAYQSLMEDDYTMIRNSYISNCQPTINEVLNKKEIKFTTCEDTKNQFFVPTDLKLFFRLTNEYVIFDELLNQPFMFYGNNLKNVYNDMNNDNKKNVVDKLTSILDYDFQQEGFRLFNQSNIVDWTTLEFFINLDILTLVDYAIIEVDLESYNSKYFKYNQVKENYGLNIPTTMLVLMILGENNIHDFSDNETSQLVKFIEEKITYNSDLSTVLLNLGFNVWIENDGSISVDW